MLWYHKTKIKVLAGLDLPGGSRGDFALELVQVVDEIQFWL